MRIKAMKHNLDKMSIYKLKKFFSNILDRELKEYNLNVLIGYEVRFSKRICNFKILNNGKLKIELNLIFLYTSPSLLHYSLLGKVIYCCQFIVHFLYLLESVKWDLPKSYFDGLVYCNAIEICNERKTELYSPILLWNKKNNGLYNIRPIEIICAIKALEKITVSEQLTLNEQDRACINTLKENLLLYSNFPEIAYVHRKNPTYTIIDSIKKISKQVENCPDLADKFPILTLISIKTVKKLTIKEFFFRCAKSENNFMAGIAIRLIVMFNCYFRLDFKINTYEVFMAEIKKYFTTCIAFNDIIFKQESYFLKENFFVVRRVIKAINKFLNVNEIADMSRNIHFIF